MLLKGAGRVNRPPEPPVYDEGVVAALPWHLLGSGGVIFAAGLALYLNRAWLDRLLTAQGGREAGPRERTVLPILVLISGGGPLFAFLTEVVALFGGARPYWMAAGTLVWFPLAGLSLAAAVLWLVLLRRLT